MNQIRSIMSKNNNKNRQANLVLFGDTEVGKTSLVLRFAVNEYYPEHEPTIGAAVSSHKLSLNEATVHLDIWDMAGEEWYRSFAKNYYRSAAVAFVVYDITNMDSYDRAKEWVTELRERGNLNMIMFLVGNKADINNSRQVSTKEAEKYAKDNRLTFVETSAKTGLNVNELFHETAQRLARTEMVDLLETKRRADKILRDIDRQWERKPFRWYGSRFEKTNQQTTKD